MSRISRAADLNAVTAPSGNQGLVLITGQGATSRGSERRRGECLHGGPQCAPHLAGDANASASIAANAITLGRHAHPRPAGHQSLRPRRRRPFSGTFSSPARRSRGVCQCECKLREPLRREPLAGRHDTERARCDVALSPPASRRARRTSRRMHVLASTRRACSPGRARPPRRVRRRARRECVARPGLGGDRCARPSAMPISGRAAPTSSAARPLGPRARASGLRHQPRRPVSSAASIGASTTASSRHRRDLRGDLGELQGWLAHE